MPRGPVDPRSTSPLGGEQDFRPSGPTRGETEMADIFNEIDEELRQEKLKKLWDRYGVLLLVVAVLIVAAVGGWRAYDHWRGLQAQAQGDAFAAAGRLAAAGDVDAAEKAFTTLAGTASGGYPALARLRAAGLKTEPAEAVAAFDAIAADKATPALFADVARIRAAALAIDLEERAAFEARTAQLAAAGRPFRGEARELLALAALKAGDAAAATRWLDDLDADASTPRELSERTAMLRALLLARAPSGKAN